MHIWISGETRSQFSTVYVVARALKLVICWKKESTDLHTNVCFQTNDPNEYTNGNYTTIKSTMLPCICQFCGVKPKKNIYWREGKKIETRAKAKQTNQAKQHSKELHKPKNRSYRDIEVWQNKCWSTEVISKKRYTPQRRSSSVDHLFAHSLAHSFRRYMQANTHIHTHVRSIIRFVLKRLSLFFTNKCCE